VNDYVGSVFPQATLLDHTLTPMPVNPLCWEVILAQADSENYVLRRAVLALMPRVLPASRCPTLTLETKISAPLTDVADKGGVGWQWRGELVMPHDRLKQLASRYCDAAVLLRFARDPWAVWRDEQWLLGDLRYDRETQLGFAEIELQDTQRCAQTPPWTAPRNTLLQ
jgi:inner membrane protein